MANKKEWLPYVLLVRDFKDLYKLRLMATDGGDGMQISRWVIVDVRRGWIGNVGKTFGDLVDPQTLTVIREKCDDIIKLIYEGGKNAVWIGSDGIKNMA